MEHINYYKAIGITKFVNSVQQDVLRAFDDQLSITAQINHPEKPNPAWHFNKDTKTGLYSFESGYTLLAYSVISLIDNTESFRYNLLDSWNTIPLRDIYSVAIGLLPQYK